MPGLIVAPIGGEAMIGSLVNGGTGSTNGIVSCVQNDGTVQDMRRNRMNYLLSRVKYIDRLRRMRYPLNKILVVGSGIMALAGMKTNDDLDLWAAPDVFKKMKNDRNLKAVMKHGRLFYESHDEAVEISDQFPCTKKGGINPYLKRAVVVQGIHFMSLEDLRDWKKCMGRPKDKIAVQQINRLLGERDNKMPSIYDKLEDLYERGVHDTNPPGYFIDKSKIHGQGVHAGKWLDPEMRVGSVTKPYPHITPMGKMINHSSNPNCVLRQTKEDGHDLFTNQKVKAGDELTVDYSKYEGFDDPDPSWT